MATLQPGGTRTAVTVLTNTITQTQDPLMSTILGAPANTGPVTLFFSPLIPYPTRQASQVYDLQNPTVLAAVIVGPILFLLCVFVCLCYKRRKAEEMALPTKSDLNVIETPNRRYSSESTHPLKSRMSLKRIKSVMKGGQKKMQKQKLPPGPSDM
ncbi:hypothetical protein HK099_005438 [Clydaea vesicula]|uniref:Uncharacterized protein n=1 Tax=Clydaea vesicula TaxID=447962 RepID=A0AAD5U2H6_9FUNG|nr:hypothetical protein HK099_005438 [Clydaea vesicula]KAJ3384901.1 hypothetical protein HDU92_003330 [Lobulomyces angularis]